MADRWTDERDRERRDQDWRRSERFGRGREQDRDRDFGQQGFESRRGGEDRSFDRQRGGYDDDRGYGQERHYGGDRDRESRYGGAQSGYGGRYQSGYRGGQSGGAYRGSEAYGGQSNERDRVFGERETGASYRPASQPLGGDYGGSPAYGREPGRPGQQYGGPDYGRNYGYGSGGAARQSEYGRGGEHFGQPYGTEARDRGQDYTSGGRYYGDDGREPIYREQYGQGGREYGETPRGYDTPQWRGGAETYGGRSSGAASQSWTGSQNVGERWRDRDEREYSPNVREGRGEGGRSWWDRAKNQVASLFGDEDAQRQADWDRRSQPSEGHRGRGPKGYKRSDERITEEVNQRLTDDPWIDASEIDVSVKDSEVTLSGTVSDREEKRRAERVVEDIWGVTHVQNNLRVQQGQTSGVGGNPREGAGSVLGRGSSDTSSQNPITGTGHGFGDTMLAAGDPGAMAAVQANEAQRGTAGGDGQSSSQAGSTGASSASTASTGKDVKKS